MNKERRKEIEFGAAVGGGKPFLQWKQMRSEIERDRGTAPKLNQEITHVNKERRKEIKRLIEDLDTVVCQYGVTVQAVGAGGIPVGPDLRKKLETAVEYLAYFLEKSK